MLWFGAKKQLVLFSMVTRLLKQGSHLNPKVVQYKGRCCVVLSLINGDARVRQGRYATGLQAEVPLPS